MPDTQMPLHQAADVLRGHGIAISHQERSAAAFRVLRELERLNRVSVWSRRLVDALAADDEDATAKARRGLEDALTR
jgi:hypothetical protein